MAIQIHRDRFHPMLDHVEVGNEVLFPDGTVLTLKHTMSGWTLVDKSGRQMFEPVGGAYALMGQIIALGDCPSMSAA
jgi:hypothetical protein